MKDAIGGQIVKEFVGLRAKTYSYLKYNNDQDKKAQSTKICAIKRKLEFENYKKCLEAVQIENEVNHLEKNKTDEDSLKEDQKKFIKNNELISKRQKRFKSEKHNVFTEETNRIALSSTDDKRMQLTDSIKTYAYGINKNLVCKKEEVKCSNIIKI